MCEDPNRCITPYTRKKNAMICYSKYTSIDHNATIWAGIFIESSNSYHEQSHIYKILPSVVHQIDDRMQPWGDTSPRRLRSFIARYIYPYSSRSSHLSRPEALRSSEVAIDRPSWNLRSTVFA